MSMRRSRGASERGAVAILVAVLVPVLILLTAVAVDIGRWYVEAARVQKAADAAALGGVTYMPNNYDTSSPNAQTTAGDVSGDNGYTASTAAACALATKASGTKCITTFKTGVQSQLGVTVSSTISNVFGNIFGNPTTTIARTAVADYQGPAIMGSPCNTFGNEPNSTSGTVDPVDTSIPDDSTQGGYATCQSRTPNFWATIEGPQTDKIQGDRYSTIDCSTSTDGCNTGANDEGGDNGEYDKNGYFFLIRVGETAKLQPITVQLFDPAFIFTGTTCGSLPSSATVNVSGYSRTSNVTTITTSSNHGLSVGDGVGVAGVGGSGGYDGSFTVTATPSNTQFRYANTGSNGSGGSGGTIAKVYNGMNPYVPSDATTRYAQSGTSGFCTGDYFPGGGSNPMVTSFVLRNKTLTYDPLQAAPISGCTKQFGSVTSGPSAASLNRQSSGTTYKGQVARLLHQWYTLCTFTPGGTGPATTTCRCARVRARRARRRSRLRRPMARR